MNYEEALKECERRNEKEKFSEYIPREAQPGVWKLSFRLRADWRRFSTSDRLDRPVVKGERFVAADDIEVLVTTHWYAPFTGGNRMILPRGTVMVASYDQHPDAPGFSSVPENYTELEEVLVPEEDRSAEKYSSYSVSFILDDIGTRIDPLE
jgi:hypothetical protein